MSRRIRKTIRGNAGSDAQKRIVGNTGLCVAECAEALGIVRASVVRRERALIKKGEKVTLQALAKPSDGRRAYPVGRKHSIEGESLDTHQIAERIGLGYQTTNYRVKILVEKGDPLTWQALSTPLNHRLSSVPQKQPDGTVKRVKLTDGLIDEGDIMYFAAAVAAHINRNRSRLDRVPMPADLDSFPGWLKSVQSEIACPQIQAQLGVYVAEAAVLTDRQRERWTNSAAA